jgi:hypothetical protein
MGYAYCTSACFGCGRLFSYNPVRVPSIRVNGNREPICQTCVDRVNPQRVTQWPGADRAAHRRLRTV